MKFCKDCKFCRVPSTYHPGELGGWSERHWDRATCDATVDFVTGGGHNSRRCADERNDLDGCGPGAVKFDAIPPPPPRPPRGRGLFARLFR